MPAGETAHAAAKRRVPLHLMLVVRLPQREVTRVLLLLVDRDARAFFELVDDLARQLAVARELRDLEVHVAVVDLVCDALLQQVLDDHAHLRDEVGRARHVVRHAHVQQALARVELVFVLLGNVPRGAARLLARRLHLVFARLDVVIGQVTDVGDVHHLRDLEALVLHEAAQHVGEQEAAEVADVRTAVDRRPAVIHRDLARQERAQFVEAAGQRVVEADRHRSCAAWRDARRGASAGEGRRGIRTLGASMHAEKAATKFA